MQGFLKFNINMLTIYAVVIFYFLRCPKTGIRNYYFQNCEPLFVAFYLTCLNSKLGFCTLQNIESAIQLVNLISLLYVLSHSDTLIFSIIIFIIYLIKLIKIQNYSFFYLFSCLLFAFPTRGKLSENKVLVHFAHCILSI